MLEKLDDRRVRFKRPISMRDVIKAEFLENDPYRCHYKFLMAAAALVGSDRFSGGNGSTRLPGLYFCVASIGIASSTKSAR